MMSKASHSYRMDQVAFVLAERQPHPPPAPLCCGHRRDRRRRRRFVHLFLGSFVISYPRVNARKTALSFPPFPLARRILSSPSFTRAGPTDGRTEGRTTSLAAACVLHCLPDIKVQGSGDCSGRGLRTRREAGTAEVREAA